MDRLIQIITTELISDRLKAEEEMERIVNDITIDTEAKIKRIKNELSNLAIINQMASIWTTFNDVAPETNNNNNS